MKLIFTLTVASLLALALSPNELVAQNTDKPFSDSSPVATERKPKREKVIVHLPTLDLCFHWMEMNKDLAQIRRQISGTSKEIESIRKDPPKQETSKLERRLGELNTAYATTKRKLDRIPLDSTFDLERWQQFKEQLRQYRMAEETRVATEEALQNENSRLRNENRELRAEIARLKNGK